MRDLCDGVEESGNTREVPTWARFSCWGRVRGMEDAEQDDEQPKHAVLAVCWEGWAVHQEGLGKGAAKHENHAPRAWFSCSAGGGGLGMRPNTKGRSREAGSPCRT